MTTLFSFLELSTVIVTLLVTASGLPACIQMYNSRCTRGVPYVLFLAYAFVSTMSVQYGLLLENKALVGINVISLMIWVAYISIYYLVTPSKAETFLKGSAMLFMYWAHLQYLALIPSDQVQSTLGTYLLFWCTVLSLIPCCDIYDMVKTKSCDCCDMNMLCATTVACVVWIFYGSVLEDINIWFPAVVGLAVNIIKFVLFFMYHSSKPKTVLKKPQKKSNELNGHMTSEFHEQVYRIKSRNILHKGIQ